MTRTLGLRVARSRYGTESPLERAVPRADSSTRVLYTELVALRVLQDGVALALLANRGAKGAKPLSLRRSGLADEIEVEAVLGGLGRCGLLEEERGPGTIERNSGIRLRDPADRGEASNLRVVIGAYRVPVEHGCPEPSKSGGMHRVDHDLANACHGSNSAAKRTAANRAAARNATTSRVGPEQHDWLKLAGGNFSGLLVRAPRHVEVRVVCNLDTTPMGLNNLRYLLEQRLELISREHAMVRMRAKKITVVGW